MGGEFDVSGERLLNAIGEVKVELVTHGMKLEAIQQQTTRTNGRVTALEDRADSHDQKHRDQIQFDAGYDKRRDDDMEQIDGALGWVGRLWPLILGAALGGIGAGSFLLDLWR